MGGRGRAWWSRLRMSASRGSFDYRAMVVRAGFEKGSREDDTEPVVAVVTRSFGGKLAYGTVM